MNFAFSLFVLAASAEEDPFCARACACPCQQSSSWDVMSSASAYLNCNVPTMLSMVGIIDKQQAKFASSLCKIAESQVGEIQKLVEKGGLEAVAEKAEEICAQIGQGVNKVEKEGINMAIVKEFNPQCRCLLRNITLFLMGKPNLPGAISCFKATQATTQKLMAHREL